MPRYTDNDIKSALGVNLQEYAVAMGFELKKSDGLSKKIEGYGGLFVFEKGFCHFSEDKKGNAINFAREYLGLGFQDAVQSLLDFRGIPREEEFKPPTYNRNNSYQKAPTQRKKQEQYQRKEQKLPDFKENLQQNYRDVPPDDFYGQPPPDDFYGQPPPDDFYGQPPPDDFYGEPPPDDFHGQPPPDLQENQMNINEKVVFEVPSMSEHDSFQQKAPPQTHAPPKKEMQEPKEPMVLPTLSDDRKFKKSFDYLTNERCLDKEIVDNLMKSGQIFEASTQFKG